MNPDRRQFIASTTSLGIAAVSAGLAHGAEEKGKPAQADVTASEDLMREHGVLNRILLIYEEGLRRIRAKQEISGEVFHSCASLVRKFVEDYHERLEENFVFPEFEKRNTLVELVKTLRQQHDAGRKLTDVILQGSDANQFRSDASHRELVRACRAFIRMYRPHEAREDTVLFPALHGALSAHEIHELGERFEEQEDKLFGEGGFEKTVGQVAAIEKTLEIYELAKFTPQ